LPKVIVSIEKFDAVRTVAIFDICWFKTFALYLYKGVFLKLL